MPIPDPAAATGLPEIPARRGFLRGLATLPLIGGGITLIGQPTKAAVPVTPQLMSVYRQFLVGEIQRIWYEEIHDALPIENTLWLPSDNAGEAFHLSPDGRTWNNFSPPSSRAAVVLAAVGCDWRRDGRAGR